MYNQRSQVTIAKFVSLPSGIVKWVLFQPSDEEDWIGVFGRGGNTHSAVAWHGSGEAFVVAGGHGYLIDTRERVLLHKADSEFFVDVIAGQDFGAFVVADDFHLYGYDCSGRRWMTHRISWDGIRNLSLEGHRVKGEAWGLSEWYGFTLDLSSGQVTGATYNGPDAQYV